MGRRRRGGGSREEEERRRRVLIMADWMDPKKGSERKWGLKIF